MGDYRDLGIETYGDKCELCHYGIVQVHHIDYQEHQDMENAIRHAIRTNASADELIQKAKDAGYLEWEHWQLSKDDRSTNLAVLCPNCHSLVHRMDVGKNLLRVIPERK